MTGPTDRFERQRDLVPAEALAGAVVSVIGVGAIGRHVALQLASVGVRRLQLIDFDRVDPTNLTTQGYRESDLGELKVVATAKAVREIDRSISVDVVADRCRPGSLGGDVAFCCVDSIAARKAIWRASGPSLRFWSDGRMQGETVRTLAVAGEIGRNRYPSTLFDPGDAHPGRCTARATIYAASIAAGLMVHQFSRFLRGLPVDPDVTLNLLASEITIEN
ncbi:MAG TPA: ThiF family adenylyltransferase [Pirellulaceae bacterium]|nr:ThiF family adenylyltransferase [Pirellulaceae bacterium]